MKNIRFNVRQIPTGWFSTYYFSQKIQTQNCKYQIVAQNTFVKKVAAFKMLVKFDHKKSIWYFDQKIILKTR
jgi:hypothetical protein